MKKEWKYGDLNTDLNVKKQQWSVVLAESEEQRAQSFEIRRKVFIEEQHVPEAEELDELEEICEHFLLLDEVGEAQGTARLWVTPENKAKLQRIAVHKVARGQGFGQVLVYVMEKRCAERGLNQLILGAQCDAVGFYKKLGYVEYGDIFDDAGIPHKMMCKTINLRA